jgi:L-ascorbate metabolism protein UlaG (beta-lactamase superfamily)
MEITWLGYSCFKLRGSRTTVITDPYSPASGHTLGKPSAGIVTISHPHADHSYASAIEGQPRLVKGPGEYEIGGVLIYGMTTFHDAEKGAVKGRNTAYVIEVDEVSICHLGDLGHVPTPEQKEELGPIDVLLVPVGGVSTVNAATAAEVVRQLDPKAVIPMHYKTPALKRDLEPVDKFLAEMGAREIAPQAKLSVTKANLPLTTQVFLLDYVTK